MSQTAGTCQCHQLPSLVSWNYLQHHITNYINNRHCKGLTTLNQSVTHTHPFNGPLSRTTRGSQYQKGKTNLDFTEARDTEWQWHKLGHRQVCISLKTDNHASTQPLSFLQAGCPSCRPANSVEALMAALLINYNRTDIKRQTNRQIDQLFGLCFAVWKWFFV